MVTDSERRGDHRGQAYTLQGIVGGLLLLLSIIVVLNSTVITPGSGGGMPPHQKEDLRVQAEDAMVVIAENDTFDWSSALRYWEQSDRKFVDAVNEDVGYGPAPPPGNVGTTLDGVFLEQGYQYNVDLRYLRPSNDTRVDESRDRLTYADRGEPSGESVTATYHVTLYDNQTITSPGSASGGVELWQVDANATDGDDGYYPIPDAVDGPIYNVVEVRLTVW